MRSSRFEEYEPELEPLTTEDSRILSELHDAYRTFCEYGWHHLTWKNLAYSLNTYLGTEYQQGVDGQLLNPQPNSARSGYLAHLNVEDFGYLTKDALWVLFQQTGFSSDYELNLAYHRPFETPAWKYLSTLPGNKLRILIIDIANVLRERTTSSQARANILSLASDWRPTFGAEYGVFQFLQIDLSPKDAASLHQLQLERSAALKPIIIERPKSFLKRALSVRNSQSRNKADSPELVGGEFQPRNRFSWPLTKRYKRLFPRKKTAETSTGPGDVTITPKSVQTQTVNEPRSAKLDRPKAITTSVSSTIQRQSSFYTLKEENISVTESIGSTHTLDSLLDFYYQGQRYTAPSSAEPTKPGVTGLDILRPDSPILVTGLGLRPDSPILAPGEPVLISRNVSLKSTATKDRPGSSCSGNNSFVTAKTAPGSRTESRLTRRSSRESFLSFESMFSDTLNLPASSAYYRLLKEKDLIPEPSIETNWSGRGQHAEYTPAERSEIPLQTEKLLGRTRTALVESVRCKRVRLVRKTVKCSRWTGVKREDALGEVQHLYRAQHAHIVRLVGTYTIGSDLAILTYPCAEWNLEQFMSFARTSHDSNAKCVSALRQFFTCTAKVLDFLHSFPIKHMDIKPQNLLVRDISASAAQDTSRYKLYFTDFGISRAYESVDDCDTESPTSFTRSYAAREVVIQESRGLSADVFSLGCVFAETLATTLDASNAAYETPGKVVETHWAALRESRHSAEGGVRPYHCATNEVRNWLKTLPIEAEPEMLAVRDWAVAMLDNEAEMRPTAHQIAEDPRLPFACLSCNLRKGPEDFEAAEPSVVTPLQAPPHYWERPNSTGMEVPAIA